MLDVKGGSMKKFFLNKTHGINNINKISLKKIIEIFSLPKDVNISLTNDEISIELRLKYDNLEISYILYFFVENLKKPEFHTLTFFIKKLYLNIKENIKIGDEVKSVLPKIKKYLKNNNKNLDFKYEEDKYYGEYLFDDGNIHIFFKKIKGKKIVDDIMISLPYEDILPDSYIVDEIKDIMEIKNKIDSFFWK